MADTISPGRLERMARPLGGSLTARTLAVNLIPLLLLAGGLFFLDSYRRQLLQERFNLARIEAQIAAEALSGATRARQEALMIQIGKEQHLRLRMYNPAGELDADSFALAPPSFVFDDPVAEPFLEDFARWTDSAVNVLVGAPSPAPYLEPQSTRADAWPEVVRARELGYTQIELLSAPDGTPVINTAAPVGVQGYTLLTTRNAVDITQSVRNARSQLLSAIGIALMVSIVLSLYLANTIIQPLRRLVRAAVAVRTGREREVEVPRMSERGDEIGVLARAVSDMTGTLRHRIDAVESFAADVAHEIKNPLASLRSAIESLPKVKDEALRGQLIEVAAHDVQRIDRLVSDISEASRIDAEISRAKFEAVDLGRMVGHLIAAREERGLNLGRRIELAVNGHRTVVMGVALRLERIISNLLDNAISFSPEGGAVEVRVERQGERVVTTVSDHGPGIAPDKREDVFRRFHSDRPDAEGFGHHSGLGLAIARTIAEAHGGSLYVADRSDGAPGACLVLDLPGVE
ncbi:HAMP domain-containing sensor histidine kinase [Alteraurantiacibacter buctensis]|uniref:histidine kinase n=1 Tax=Alteraurantiacibacter buctensis TaxID=1503981 RepID=A0A844Z068_9SPHN|nr:ATP-binding protein [Alteraurantiacibacter buctensis]MXO72646.1 HAMP domain-containing protein [Alteraurantiacibacter buctensis]